MGPTPPHPLAAWLGRLPADRLHDVLTARPDALRPTEPGRLAELAERLADRRSVARAASRLTLRALQAAEAVAALAGMPAPEDPPGEGVPEERLLAMLGDERGVAAALAELARYALVWPDEAGSLLIVEPLRQTWAAPLGLGRGLVGLMGERTAEELAVIVRALGLPPSPTKQRRLAAVLEHHGDADRVAALAAAAPPETRDLLTRAGRTVSDEPVPASRPGLRWALDRGLLVRPRRGTGAVTMPAEVALALRGTGWRAPFAAAPPEPPLRAAAPAAVAAQAAAAAQLFASQAAAVFAACAAGPPARLRGGGVGSREVLRIARAAQCGEPEVRLALESGRAAGLLARDGERFAVTAAWDAWAEQDPGHRLAVLLRAWWSLPDTPTSDRDAEGRVRPALGEGLPRNDRLAARRALLGAAARLPEGRGARHDEALAALVSWHRPMARRLDQDAPPFAGLLREAALLGVLACGALTPLGAALRSGSEAALVSAARALLPAPAERARFGGDLTAVVTGTPAAALERLLDEVAERESRGVASVWRFTPSSVRRALDGGRSAESVEAALGAVTDRPLPQPLTYLIRDAARRHGRLQVVAAPCVIHAEDAAMLSEVLFHRGLAALGLRRLAPTVLVGRSPVAEALAALRAHGYAPVAEAADGTVRVERPVRPRAAALPAQRAEPPAPADRPEPDTHRLALRLAADSSVSLRVLAEKATELSLDEVRQLAAAVDAGRRITVDYVTSPDPDAGRRVSYTVSRFELDSPDLFAWCEETGAEEDFLIRRIVAVRQPGPLSRR
ncbi:helicase-associated domain-containing protein [Streptomyces marincola]|uniref:helicase-associated domain-containing protein n=1 Tax=Streptomyces marincola TaxID=2878388 RepID=UPI001CF5E9D4|nr:helicase-associated domain-containing protein [Streptomyces marincola]UCM90895.1 helicase-associated domain-containing protein [Streptomyces marincola]